jgi:hypothetical protein
MRARTGRLDDEAAGVRRWKKRGWELQDVRRLIPLDAA